MTILGASSQRMSLGGVRGATLARGAAALLLILWICGPAFCDEPVTHGTPTAESASKNPPEKAADKAGDKADAPQPKDKEGPPDEVTVLKEKILKVQNEGKLRFRKSVLCSSVQGYGQYSPVTGGPVSNKLILYVEPANYGVMISSDRYVIDCLVEITVIGGGGKVLHEAKQKLNFVTRTPKLDVYYAIGVQLKKPLEKSMTIKTVLHDNIKNESASTAITLNINQAHGV
jgi:hypothetical protein